MRLETQTKYKCDGCAQEQLVPHGWMSIVPLLAGGMSFNLTAGHGQSQDYCVGCFKLMMAALPRPNKSLGTGTAK